MERISLIRSIYVALAADYPHIVQVRGIPDVSSLHAYFEPVAFVGEKAELTETVEDSDQGMVIRRTLTANTYRENQQHLSWINRPLLIYIETIDNQRILMGTIDHPAELSYTSRTGAALGDVNDNSLTYTHTVPL